jgi:hypothetical protein
MAQEQDARGGVITVATMLWDKNSKSYAFSKMYNEDWVVKLYNGFARNLNVPWRFVLFTDRPRDLPKEIKQDNIRTGIPDYSCYIEPFRYGVPMILCGLDTVVVGSVDHLANYCLTHDRLALPRDPNDKTRSCNGVALIPGNQQHVYRNWPKGENDMVYLRKQDHDYIDDLFPGQVVSYKGHVKKNGLGNARIVYFHGNEKPHELDVEWIAQHWR